MNSNAFSTAESTLQAWRERGGDRLDPVRFRFIEVLTRRTAGQHGEARRILELKVTRLLATYGQTVDHPRTPTPTPTLKGSTPPHSALAQLVEDIARQRDGMTAPPSQTLRYVRSTWSRLDANRRLTQSLAKEPENAGPLNSHHLVLRSLTLMRDLSPDYLHHFMSHVDALSALEHMNNSAPTGGAGPRADGGKKAARGKANG